LKALSTAIFAKCAVGTDFYTDISGRLYKGRAPANATYPYAVYMLVSDVPDFTFTEDFERVLIQFSLFSLTSGTTQVEDMFTHLKALYDDCALTITGETLLWMRRENAILMPEDHTTTAGTAQVWHYSVDYSVFTKVG